MNSFLYYYVYRNRKSIEGTTGYTIRFKELFPTFDIWKQSLKDNGVDENKISQSDFTILELAIGNQFLRYSTEQKNKGFIGYTFNRLDKIKDRYQKLYDLSIEEMLKSEQSSERTHYLVNRSENGDNLADYINNVVKDKISSSATPIQVLEKLNKFVDMNDPTTKFINELCLTIVRPLQPNQKGTTVI